MICNVRRTLPLTAGGLGVAVSPPTGPGQSPASLEKDLNGLKEEDTGRPVPRDELVSNSLHFRYCHMKVRMTECWLIHGKLSCSKPSF